LVPRVKRKRTVWRIRPADMRWMNALMLAGLYEDCTRLLEIVEAHYARAEQGESWRIAELARTLTAEGVPRRKLASAVAATMAAHGLDPPSVRRVREILRRPVDSAKRNT
jgi:hypothetical protein